MLCVLANVLLIALAFFLRSLGTTIVVSILVVTSFTLILIIYYLRPKAKISSFSELSASNHVLKNNKIIAVSPKSIEVN